MATEKQKITEQKGKGEEKKEIVVGTVSPLLLPIEMGNICSWDPRKVKGKITRSLLYVAACSPKAFPGCCLDAAATHMDISKGTTSVPMEDTW